MNPTVLQSLLSFGAIENEILFFDSSDYRSINYATLIKPTTSTVLPEGVIETAERPLLYFIDSSNLASDHVEKSTQIHDVLNILSCRGENAFLAIVSLGELTVLPIKPNMKSSGFSIKKEESNSKGFIRNLAEGILPTHISEQLNVKKDKNSAVDTLLFDLLTKVGKGLNSSENLKGKHDVILSLIGRALLTRFLIDRNILTKETAPNIFAKCDPLNCFSNAENISLTNQWLDDTFNGDLLELPVKKEKYFDWFSKQDTDLFSKLSFILGHADENGQLSLPDFIDFAHVPVGLLSEVYERYAHENLDDQVRKNAKKESIHYTPRHIADFMLSQAFDSVSTTQPMKSKVLDPSCGAGVFIILAFRRIITEQWKKTGKRPDTYQIREILYKQLSGFDINNAALTLAALGLYLTALELDPEPLPTTKLRFENNLIGSVLKCLRNQDELWPETAVVMGSLGTFINPDQSYDIVIGNPPWSSFPKEMGKQLSECVRSVAKNRDPVYLSDIAENHHNPDQVPDLPFVWKSTEWAKPGGTIAFALHARLLFKYTPPAIKARAELFKALNITGILNGTAFRQTANVWPNIGAQFCILFAKNTIPDESNYFNFVSPQYEKQLNDSQGRIRIDHSNAEPIQANALQNNPHLLKILYKGTALDANTIEYLLSLFQEKEAKPILEYWNKNVGVKRTGVGFQTTSNQLDASHLIEMGAVVLSKQDNADYIVDTSLLEKFNTKRLHRPREGSIYETPLVLLNKAIAAKKETISARISLGKTPIAYNESFYGYSTCGHSSSAELAKYLFAILNSDLFLYYTLMISSQYGIEREVIHKKDADSFPIIPFEKLTSSTKAKINKAFDSFKEDFNVETLNSLVYSIYKLNKYDKQVIEDTLSVSLPIASSRNKAQEKITNTEINKFCRTLSKTLEPHDLEITPLKSVISSWVFLNISPKNIQAELNNDEVIAEIAENMGTTKIIFKSEKQLTIGLLNQYRYWTPSRARLIGLQLIEQHSTELGFK